MLNVVLFAPEIPANTGNIGRTCVLTGTRLHLIRPLGFRLDDKSLKRAGLDYWHNLDVSVYASWDEFLKKNVVVDDTTGSSLLTPGHLTLLTKKSSRLYTEVEYASDGFIVFGSESSGIPEEILADHPDLTARIPMLPDGEALSEGDFSREGLARKNTNDAGWSAKRTSEMASLNLSNAAAIVLFEALRQNGFPGLAREGHLHRL